MKDETRQLELDMGKNGEGKKYLDAEKIAGNSNKKETKSKSSRQTSWKISELGEICEFAYGKSLPAKLRTGSGFEVFGSNGSVGLHEEALTDGETIVIGRKGSFGEIHYSAKPCFPIDTTYYITSKQTNAHLPWLARRLRCLSLNQLNRASSIPGLNRNDAYRQVLLVPPLEEQKRIARILDAADELRAKRRQALAELDTFLQSVFLDMFGDPVTNPKGWNKCGIDEICIEVVDCVNRTAPTVDYKTPFKMIRTTNIRHGLVDITNVKYVDEEIFHRWNRRCIPIDGDVLLTREAPVGEAGILRGKEQVFLGQRIMLYRPNLECITSEYLLYVFMGAGLQRQFDQNGSGSTVKHLPLPVCRSFRILTPPINLQRKFTTIVEKVEQQKAQMREHLAELDALFASLQHRAFNGEL